MTPKEIYLSLSQIDSRISQLRAQISLQEKVRTDIITSATPDILPHAEPLLSALIHGRRDETDGVISIFNPYVNSLRHAIAPLTGKKNIVTYGPGKGVVTTGGWDGKGTLELTAMIEELEARKDLLTASLPSEEDILEAERNLSDLHRELTSQEEEYAAKWNGLLSSLETAAVIAEDFRSSVPDTRTLRRRIDTLVETYGLTLPSPPADMKNNLSPYDKRAASFAYNLANFILRSLVDSGAVKPLEVTGAETLKDIYAPLESDLERENVTRSLETARRKRDSAVSSLDRLRDEIATLTFIVDGLEDKVKASNNYNAHNPDFVSLRKAQGKLDDAVNKEARLKKELDDVLSYAVYTLEKKLASLPEKKMREKDKVEGESVKENEKVGREGVNVNISVPVSTPVTASETVQ